jgi:hypothetical protein
LGNQKRKMGTSLLKRQVRTPYKEFQEFQSGRIRMVEVVRREDRLRAIGVSMNAGDQLVHRVTVRTPTGIHAERESTRRK